MFDKALRIVCLLLLFVAILYADDDGKDNDENNVDNADKAKIELILSKIKDDKAVYAPVLRDIINSDPEKYLKVLHELKGKFSLQANRLTLEFIRGIEEYIDGKDFIETAGKIINHDFKMTQLAIVETQSWSDMGWLVRVNSSATNSFYLMLNTLEIEAYNAQRFEYKIMDWLTIFEDLEGKYRSNEKIDTFYVAAELALWAWVGLCKEDYIAAGLAWDSCKQVLSRTTDDQNQTKPNTVEVLKQRKQKIQEILADYKLKQIKESSKFDNSFENILKSLQVLNAAFTIKSDTKTEVQSLTQQFEKTQKFLDETASETEQNKPLNKLIRAIILCPSLGDSPNSYQKLALGGSIGVEINEASFPMNFLSEYKQRLRLIWDLIGDFLPEKNSEITELLKNEGISVGFFTVKDFIANVMTAFIPEGFWDDENKKITDEKIKLVENFFSEMPKSRLEFYRSLHQKFFVLRTFAINELSQTNYDEVKKLILSQQIHDDVVKLSGGEVEHALSIDDILRQMAVFVTYTNKENFDEEFFKKLFESKYEDDVLYVLAEMLWGKFQSTISYDRLADDLQNSKFKHWITLDEIKSRINLLQVMSHTSDEIADKFRNLMLNLMTSENDKVQFVLFQIFEKYGVPDSFVEKVQIASTDKKILFQKPDPNNFPMMVSNLAMSIIAAKNELPESYRTSASYFDRQIMFAYLMKILGNQNEYDELVKKYKVDDEEVPEDLEPLKQLILDYLYTMEADKKKKLFDEIISAPGAWEALRASGSDKSDLEIEKLRQLADDISRRIKIVEHLSNDKTDEKFTAELNALKGKSLSYLEYGKLAHDWSIKFDFKEIAVYTERLADGKGLRLLVYTIKSSRDIEAGNGYREILAAKYTRYGASQMVESTDFRDTKGPNLLEYAVEGISAVSAKYAMSQFEFYYHIQH